MMGVFRGPVVGVLAGVSCWPRRLLLSAFVVLASSLLWKGARRPAVLVVHSQSEGVPWTQGIDAGFDAVFGVRKEVRLQRIYLNAHDTQRVADQVNRAHGFIARWRPDALITVDDFAQLAVGTRYVDQVSPQVVYSGIEDAGRSLATRAASNVSGIVERTPWAVVERTLLRLARPPDGSARQANSGRPLRVAMINDGGAASDEEARGFALHPWAHAVPVGVWRCQTLAEWRTALHEIAHRADLVVVGDYRAIPVPEGTNAPIWTKQLATQALDALPQPMVALSYYAVRDGIPMGVLPSPMEQGAVAARYALRALSGSSAGSPLLPQYSVTSEFALVVNPESMAQRRLAIGAVDAYYARLSSRMLGSGGR